MLLGYERIVKDKRILISVEDSYDPWVTLKVGGCKDITFKACERPENLRIDMNSEIRDEIKQISYAVYEAYRKSTNDIYLPYVNS